MTPATANPDLTLARDAEALRESYGGHWGQHPEFPTGQWVQAVCDDETRLGYWEWVANAQAAVEVEEVS